MNTDTPRLLAEFPESTPAEWRKVAEETLKGAPFDKKLITPTIEGINLQPIYTREDAAKLSVPLTPPGTAPFIRGPRALGYKKQGWWIAQDIPAGTPADFNAAVLHDLAAGQTAVAASFDVAGRRGLDPAQSKAGEVGVCGLSLSTVTDVRTAFAGVDLLAAPVLVYAGSSGAAITALFAEAFKENGADWEHITAGIESDPLGELVTDGHLPADLSHLYDEQADLARWIAARVPRCRTLSARGHVYHDAGASAVQELAFTLATAVEYVRALLERGLTFDVIAARLSLSFSVGSNFFMEIAKLRTARWLWSRIASSFGGEGDALNIWVHARTSLWNRTARDPYVNLLRGTTEAFSAVLASVDSLHVGPFDEVIRPPDEFSRRIARNTQLVLWHESQVPQVADPAGGSWYLESLTEQLGHKAWALFQEIEGKGGMAAALQAGFPQAEVQKLAGQRLKSVAGRRQTIVGVNQFANATEKPLDVPASHGASVLAARLAEINAVKSQRNAPALNAALAAVDVAKDRMSALTVAASMGATLSELTGLLRSGVAAGPTVTPLPAQRASAGFEALRATADRYAAKAGHAPKAFLATMGPPSQHRGRGDFSRGFLEAGGFEVVYPLGFKSVEDAVKAAAESGAKVVTLCSTDETYPELVPAFTSAVKQAVPGVTVVLAGYPADHLESFRAAGVDEFIHLRSDAQATLAGLLKRVGALS